MQRRKFIQFMGASMVGVSLAVFGTGVVSGPAKYILPGLLPEADDHVRYQDNITEYRWIGGEQDTFDKWAAQWAQMSGRPNRFIEHDLMAQENRHNMKMTDSYKQSKMEVE